MLLYEARMYIHLQLLVRVMARRDVPPLSSKSRRCADPGSVCMVFPRAAVEDNFVLPSVVVENSKAK